MTFKIVVFSCLVAVASAGLLPAAHIAYPAPLSYTSHVGYAAPLTYNSPINKIAAVAPIAKIAVEEYDANPQYTFSYDVQDSHTGDSKSQHESRNGDVVQGSYSVVDPDGVKRTVEYSADPHNGFNAVVHREPLAVKAIAPVVTKVTAPVAYAATPVVHSAPIVHASPLSYSTSLYHH